jgi:hypothetical protein
MYIPVVPVVPVVYPEVIPITAAPVGSNPLSFPA